MKKDTMWTLGTVLVVVAGLYGLSQYKADGGAVDSAALNAWTRGGGETAPVTLVEYSDFQCPACAAYKPLVARLSEEFGDRLRLVYRHFPLMQIHRNAVAAGKAAEASGRQGKFWEMHDMLFDKQKEWSDIPNPADTFVSYARALGLDEERFKSDIKDPAVEDAVFAHARQGNRDSVNATPTFLLNGQAMQNPQNYDEFRAAIQSAIDASSPSPSSVSTPAAQSTAAQ